MNLSNELQAGQATEHVHLGFIVRLALLLLPKSLHKINEAASRRAVVASLCLITSIIIVTSLGIVRLLYGNAAPLLLPVLMILGSLVVALRAGKTAFVGHSVSLLSVVAVIFLTLMAGGLGSLPLAGLAMVPLVGLLILGIRGGLLWTVLCCLVVAGFKYMEIAGIPMPFEPQPERILPAFGTILMTAISFIIGLGFERAREASERSIVERERETTALLKALPDHLLRVYGDRSWASIHQGSAETQWPKPQPNTSLFEAFPGLSKHHEAIEAVLRGERTEALVETELENPQEKREIEFRFAQLPPGALVLARDITESRKLARRIEDIELSGTLERADRMASLGVLAAGVAHEVNNPLTYLNGNVAVALSELESDTPDLEVVTNALRDVHNAGERIKRVIADMKGYVRTEDEQEEAVDLAAATKTAIKLAKNELQHRAKLVVEDNNAPLAKASESRVVQVVLNLLVNAAQAIEPGAASDNTITLLTGEDDKGRPVLEIRDTGPGIPPEVLSKIREPFFTTKPVGIGTGLGLSICQSIVRRFDGELNIYSKVGLGTTVTVSFQPTEGSLQQAPEAKGPPSNHALQSRRRVLVIDDESMIRTMISRLLKEVRVVEAESGQQALDILEENSQFDAILCDVMMPNMTGIDLFQNLQKNDPELSKLIIFMTGGAFDHHISASLEQVAGTQPVLNKPFKPSELRKLLKTRFV